MSKTNDKTHLRLKAVIQCDFGRSEANNLKLYRLQPHYPGDLASGEAFLFFSKTGNQVIFVFRDPTIEFEGDETRHVTDSRRLRLDGGTWSPYMLQNYANLVGLHLVGIKRFEQVHAEMQERKQMRKTGGSGQVSAE